MYCETHDVPQIGGDVGGGLPEAMLVQQLAHHPIVNATIITATRVSARTIFIFIIIYSCVFILYLKDIIILLSASHF